MANRSLASERNLFPQDIERLSSDETSPRRSWVSKNLSSLVYTAISLIVFAYYYFTFYPLVGNNGFNDSNSTTVVSQNYTPKSATFPASTSTVSPSIPYESSIPNATSWTTANEVPWIIPTTASATAEPITMPTTVPTVSTTDLATTVTSSTSLEVKNWTITVTSANTTPEASVEPRRFGHSDENSYVADDDEYDRPQFMGKVPWDWCVPRWQPLDEFVDKQWMCNRCHAEALAGIYKIEEFYIRDYEYWCFRMCFINSILEECAVHLNRTQPRPSPDAARDCSFCEEQERHRKSSRLLV